MSETSVKFEARNGIGVIGQIRRIAEEPEYPCCDLPVLVRDECHDILGQIAEKTELIVARTKKIKALAEATDTARHLQTMPGVGSLTALAVEAFAPPMETFRRGRDFAAWLGLVPRQYPSGGKEGLGRVSKAGQADIRRLPIIGACRPWTGRDGTQIHPRRVVTGATAGTQAEDAGRHRACQPDGARDLGNADQSPGLQGTGSGGIRVTETTCSQRCQ